MSDPTQQPPSDPYQPQQPYQPQPPYQGPGAAGQPPHHPYGPPQQPHPQYAAYGQPLQPMFPVAPRPNHPQATTSMVLGIISLVGGFMCALPLLVAPVAWVMGHKAVKEIDASGGALGGRGEAQTGFITGIIGTILLILGIALVVVLIVIAINVDDHDGHYYDAVWQILGQVGR